MSNFEFDNIVLQASSEISEQTKEIMEKLKQIWTETFELDMCVNNIRKLPEHVALLYEEIYVETKLRQDTIKYNITTLREEAEMLTRLLNVKINLDTDDNVTLYTQQKRLDKSLHDLRESLQKRKDQIIELLLEQDSLCEELDEQCKPLLDDPLPSEEELQDFRLHLEALKAKKNDRFYQISVYRTEIKNFLKDLEIDIPEEEDELLNATVIPLTSNNLKKIKFMHDNYMNQLEEVRESIEVMKCKLNYIWDYIDVSPSVRNKFTEYTNYSKSTFDRFHSEMERCSQIKSQNIQKFVDKIREELIIWWGKTLKSDTEKSRFVPFTNDCYTDDLLSLHEMELEDLKQFYSKNEKIFELIEERKILWDRMIALDDKAADPGRYNNRGGQLLKEEKERKTTAKKLPKIEKQLIDLIEVYENEHHRKFTAFGESVEDIIALQWENRNAKKNLMISARKNKLQTATPSSSARIQSISSLIITPSTTTKRKLAVSSENLKPSAKRNILQQLKSPSMRLKTPTRKLATPFKSPMKRVIATNIKRKSLRKSVNKQKRKSTFKNIPKLLTSNESVSTGTPDTMCYNLFEGALKKDPASRSSLMCGNDKKKNEKDIKIRNENINSPRIGRTPSKLTIFQQSAMDSSPSSRKLTKNFPIII